MKLKAGQEARGTPSKWCTHTLLLAYLVFVTLETGLLATVVVFPKRVAVDFLGDFARRAERLFEWEVVLELRGRHDM